MIYLYRIYQLFIMLPIAFTATILASLFTIIVCALGGGNKITYYIAKWWAKIMCWSSLVRVTVKGRENINAKTSYVFVANHQGAYDIFAIYGHLGHNFKWMMKKSLEKIPLVGYACRQAGQIFVDNSSPAAVRKTMEDAEKRLKGGMSLVAFPEGTRSRNGKMRPFKRGAYQLAVEFGLPVVPVSISGSYEIMPKDSKISKWGHVIITIHQPIFAPAEGHDINNLIDSTYQTIHKSLPDRYK